MKKVRVLSDTTKQKFDQWEQEDTAQYREQLNANKDEALSLIIEMLRYQNWPNHESH